MSINIIVNLLGQIWVGLMAILFVPTYVRYLGSEGYGLISFFAVMQGFLGLLDMGLTATLGKESAKYIGGSYTKSAIKDLIRTYEILALVIIVTAVMVTTLLSEYIAQNWLKASSMSINAIEQAIILMGILFSVRFLEGFYRGIIIGLQEHLIYNIINATFATLKWAGVLVVLEYYGGTAKIFLLWQIIITLFLVIVFRKFVNIKIPNPAINPKFNKIYIYKNWRFTKGMALITLSVFALTNIDKIIVSKFLDLTTFGNYNLIITISVVLTIMTAPIAQTLLPKLTQNIAGRQIKEYEKNFNIGSQLIAATAGCVGILIAFYPAEIFYIWTNDVILSKKLALYLRIYCIGTVFNCLLVMPYLAQLAKEQTLLTVKANMVTVIILTPALMYFVSEFGLMAAVMVWCIYNICSFIITPRYAFKNIDDLKLLNWYKYDVIIPLILPICILAVSKLIPLNFENRIYALINLSVLGALAMISAVISCTSLREMLSRSVKRNKIPYLSNE